MDDDQKNQLRDDLEFAILRAQKLTALDSLDAPGSPRHPLELRALTDVFAVFGYAPDDLIDHHDQCAIFRRVRAELEDALRQLAANPKKYDKAILLRDRLRRMKSEFIEMQRSYEARRQQQERERLTKGATLCARKSDMQCQSLVDKTEKEIADKRLDLDKTHAVERAQLEEFLGKLQQPPAKLSKLLLQMKSTEKSLARLRLFEDARTVFIRADALEKDERARSACDFEQFKQRKREQLRAQQAAEKAELDEKLTERRYTARRRNESHRQTEAQRMSNLSLDLRHAHVLDMHGKRVFSTDPTPQVRRSHGATSSTFRGQQLLRTVQGRRLEVASLCSIHDRECGATPDGSVIYSG